MHPDLSSQFKVWQVLSVCTLYHGLRQIQDSVLSTQFMPTTCLYALLIGVWLNLYRKCVQSKVIYISNEKKWSPLIKKKKIFLQVASSEIWPATSSIQGKHRLFNSIFLLLTMVEKIILLGQTIVMRGHELIMCGHKINNLRSRLGNEIVKSWPRIKKAWEWDIKMYYCSANVSYCLSFNSY